MKKLLIVLLLCTPVFAQSRAPIRPSAIYHGECADTATVIGGEVDVSDCDIVTFSDANYDIDTIVPCDNDTSDLDTTSGRMLTIICDGATAVTIRDNTGNIELEDDADFICTPDDTLTLVCEGTGASTGTWREVGGGSGGAYVNESGDTMTGTLGMNVPAGDVEFLNATDAETAFTFESDTKDKYLGVDNEAFIFTMTGSALGPHTRWKKDSTTLATLGQDGQLYKGTVAAGEPYVTSDTARTWDDRQTYSEVGVFDLSIWLKKDTVTPDNDSGYIMLYEPSTGILPLWHGLGTPEVPAFGHSLYNGTVDTAGTAETVLRSMWFQGEDFTLSDWASTYTRVKLADTAVTPGSYTATDLTVDAQGRITAASNGTGGGGSASGAPNYTQSFSAQTSVSLTHALGTKNVIVACYDTNDVHIDPDSIDIGVADPWAIAVTFHEAETGRCIVNGLMNAGRYTETFAAQTTVTVTGATHGLGTNMVSVTCYDDADPRERVWPDGVTADDGTFDVVISFYESETGKCVIQ